MPEVDGWADRDPAMLEASASRSHDPDTREDPDEMVPTTMSPLTLVLADATENLYPARMQMAISLGWHIIFSCLGVAFPAIAVFTEWRAHRRGDAVLLDLAHTWAKAMG